MVKQGLSPEVAWEVLGRVPDPEVPVLSVVDLGIVRDVRITTDAVEVDVTPTYSGCPAMRVIEEEIEGALMAARWLVGRKGRFTLQDVLSDTASASA